MTDLAAWIAVVVAVVTLGIALIAYKSQRNKRRLEYVVTTNTPILPSGVARHLQVLHDGTVVDSPGITIVRLANTGDRAIEARDFETDLTVRLQGVEKIASASITHARPRDLSPQVAYERDLVRISPALINPGDMLQLQVLSSGHADAVIVAGRIANLSRIPQRRDLPYPPGTGPEGEMLGFDKFMWYVVTPGALVGFSVPVGAAFASKYGLSAAGRWITAISLSVVIVVLNHLYTRYLVQRRRAWRP